MGITELISYMAPAVREILLVSSTLRSESRDDQDHNAQIAERGMTFFNFVYTFILKMSSTNRFDCTCRHGERLVLE